MRSNRISKNSVKKGLVTLGVALTVGVFSAGIVAQAADLPNGRANNPVPSGSELCDLNIGFVIDRSNSIRNDSEANPGIITKSVGDVVDGLRETESKVAVWSFGTKATGYTGANPLPNSPVITAADYPGVGFTSVKTANGAQTVKNTVASIPYESEKSTESLRRAGWTNWQAAFNESVANGDRPADADIVFVVTDGDPTVPTNDLTGQDPDHSIAIAAGVQAADNVKSNGKTRVVALGVGQATKNSMFVNNLKRLSGGLDSAQAGSDYYTGDFSELGVMLSQAITQACQPDVKEEVPVTPVATLPKTGPASVVATFVGMSTLAGGAHAVLTSKRRK